MDADADSIIAEAIAETRAAAKALEAHEQTSLAVFMRAGEALTNLKRVVLHGQFEKVCREIFGKRESSVSLYRRLFEARDQIEPAMEWAQATDHKWRDCVSPKLVLKVVADWQRSNCANGPVEEQQKKRKEPMKQALLDLLQVSVNLEVDLALLAADPNRTIAEKWCQHLTALDSAIVQTCDALQVSRPARKPFEPSAIDNHTAIDPKKLN